MKVRRAVAVVGLAVGLVITLALAGVAAAAWSVASYLQAREERESAAAAASRAAFLARVEAIRARDAAPSTAFDPLALDAPTLDRMIDLRRALAPRLAEIARVEDEANEEHFFSHEWPNAEHERALALLTELERSGLTPRRLTHAVQVVDWRFLSRPEAVGFVLPDDAWMDYHVAMGSERFAAFAFDREEAPAVAARFQPLAPGDRTLSAATQALLESRRAEIESLGAADLPLLDAALRSLDWFRGRAPGSTAGNEWCPVHGRRGRTPS